MWVEAQKGRDMSTSKLYFMDNLKWFIIWLMVVFHAAMCYMAYAPEWWYVVDTAEPSILATAFVCWADIFIMSVMFFVSGYFGIQSLARHDAASFWKRKLKRIILPWIFGSVFIAPFVTYIILASRHSTMGFWEFYTTLFCGVMYQQAQYWYLGALTALYALMTIFCRCVPSFLRQGEAGKPSTGWAVTLFAVSALSIGFISSWMHPDTWSFYAYILVLQPVRIPSHVLAYYAGMRAWKERWFLAGGYTPSFAKWGISFLLTGAVYLWQKMSFPYTGTDGAAFRWLNALCQAAFMWASVFFLPGAFRRIFNTTSPVLAELSATSYAVYYLHMPILFCIAWAFVEVPINIGIKYLIVCFLSLAACFFIARQVLLRMESFGPR